MISITTANGNLVRTIPEISDELVVGLHRSFGWISEQGALVRARVRKSFGLRDHADEWRLRCRIQAQKSGAWALEAIDGCQVERVANNQWSLNVGEQKFLFTESEPQAPFLAAPSEEKSGRFEAIAALVVLLLLLAAVLLRSPEVVVEPEKIEEPILVKVTPPERAVVVPTNQAYQELTVKSQAKPVEQSARNVIKSKMGFLDLLGRKDLKKAVGGAPTSIKDASPGAGAGGNAGSGGELLVGLGEGIHKTTVGNSGVAGLGGVGTKGRGGGAGGYGDVALSAGQGMRISNVAMGNDVVLEGGLSQAVIQATIAKYLSQVRACYEEGLRTNPALTGLVNSNFEIGPAGDVGKIEMNQSTLGDKNVETCISKRMLTWQFPRPVGGVRVKVNYPFLLRPVRS